MATKTINNGTNTVERLTDCPYCDTDLRNTKASSHFPCDETPTTEEVIQALKAKGIR